MHPNTASTPAAAEQRARSQLDDTGIFALIGDPCFADTFAEHAPTYRNRLYTPARIRKRSQRYFGDRPKGSISAQQFPVSRKRLTNRAGAHPARRKRHVGN